MTLVKKRKRKKKSNRQTSEQSATLIVRRGTESVELWRVRICWRASYMHVNLEMAVLGYGCLSSLSTFL